MEISMTSFLDNNFIKFSKKNSVNGNRYVIFIEIYIWTTYTHATPTTFLIMQVEFVDKIF